MGIVIKRSITGSHVTIQCKSSYGAFVFRQDVKKWQLRTQAYNVVLHILDISYPLDND